MSLQAVVELVDKMSGPLKSLTSLVGEFAAGVKEGAAEELKLQQSGEKAAEGQKKLALSLGDVVKGLIGLKIAGEVFQAFTQSIQAADKLDELAGKTGIAANKLRDYQFAAEQSDASLEGMISGLDKLNRSIAKSEEETTKQAAAFEALGIKTTNADGSLRSSEETFGDIADKFKDLKDGPEKAALAFAIFGQSGKDLIPMLNRGSEGIAALRVESQQLGQMGPEAFDAYTASSGDLFDGINKVWKIIEGLVNVIAAELVPIFNVLVQSFLDSYKSGGMVAQIMDAIKVVAIGVLIPAIKAVIVVFRGFADVMDIAGKSLGALGAIIAAVAKGDIEGAKAIWKAYKEDVAKVADSHVEFKDKVFDASNATVVMDKSLDKVGETAKKTAPKIKEVAKATKEVKSSLEEMVASLKIANESFGQDESVKKKLEADAKYAKDIKAGVSKSVADGLLVEANAQIERNKTLREGEKAQELYKTASTTVEEEKLKVQILETEARLVGASKKERDAAVQVLLDEAEVRKLTNGLTGESKTKIEEEIKALQARRAGAKATISDTERLNSLMGGTWAEQSKRALEDVNFLYAEYQAGRIKSEDEYIQAVTIRLQSLKEVNKEAADEITVFWQEAAKGMQSSMSSFFFDAMQGKITSLGDRFKQMLDRMVADALAANLAEAIFGKDFGKTGNLGGFAAQGVNFLSGLFSGARASGGPVQAGRMYMVGEKGPEPFIPSVSGTIMPNSSIAGMSSSGASVVVNISAMDSQDVRRALEKDNRWLADMVNKSTRQYNLGV